MAGKGGEGQEGGGACVGAKGMRLYVCLCMLIRSHTHTHTQGNPVSFGERGRTNVCVCPVSGSVTHTLSAVAAAAAAALSPGFVPPSDPRNQNSPTLLPVLLALLPLCPPAICVGQETLTRTRTQTNFSFVRWIR